MIAQQAELAFSSLNSERLLTNSLSLSLADQLNELQFYKVKIKIPQESTLLKLWKDQD